jgi:hypothetical protein
VQAGVTTYVLHSPVGAGFGEAIAGGHSGVTAEGDNRVLWQKVGVLSSLCALCFVLCALCGDCFFAVFDPHPSIYIVFFFLCVIIVHNTYLQGVQGDSFPVHQRASHTCFSIGRVVGSKHAQVRCFGSQSLGALVGFILRVS